MLYSNRAASHLKLENYGSAISDAAAAMALDPGYLKAYYRRGSALSALSKFKDARKDFLHVCKSAPSDKDARAKLDECDKAIKRAAFEAAIATEHGKPLSETLDFNSITVDSSYKGPRLPAVPAAAQGVSGAAASASSSGASGGAGATAEECARDPEAINCHGISHAFVMALMAEFKSQGSLHKRYAVELLLRLKPVLQSLPSVVQVPWPEGAPYFNVCGDTHGQYYDLCNIFAINGVPSPTNPYLFNGDYVDRGSWSVETVLLLFAWKLLYPQHVHLTRGNHGACPHPRPLSLAGIPPSHVLTATCLVCACARVFVLLYFAETKNMNRMYGFEGEVKAKFDATVMDLFTEVFQYLPLGMVIADKVFVVHGGLCQRDGVTIKELAAIDRFREPPDSGLMTDLLWSDPQLFPGRGPSKRGTGQSFGPDITAAFLAHNNLELLIRSHEVKDEGYVVEHNGKCITVFSAPNYCDSMNNKGCIVKLRKEALAHPEFVKFEAVPHPPLRPMAYASGMSSLFGL